MSLVNILERLNAASEPSVKVAQDATLSAPSLPAVDAALAAASAITSKVASAGDQAPALDGLNKLAADAAAAEDAVMTKQAALQGAAFCDGFMSRLGAWDSAVGTKTAGLNAQPALDEQTITKIAYAAFNAAHAQIEKTAAEEYRAGYDAQMKLAHETAASIHYAGQVCAANVLAELAKG